MNRPAVPFSSLSLMLPDVQRVCLSSLQSPPFTLHFDNIQPQDVVEEFGGVIAQNGRLVHTDEFVELHSSHHEVCSYLLYIELEHARSLSFFCIQIRYGILLLCCKVADGRTACTVCSLEEILTPLGIPIMNEFDCPLLSLTHTIFTMKPPEILKAVSVVHQCTESCQFIDKECI